MSQVGKPRERITIAPDKEPVPEKVPVPAPQPEPEPVREPA